mmetsp:Transcript_75361/g.194281  ORF Transcript_75361/g.194281 Transcript_75361/m.194281 type:complete len:268 (-) Transcript_75361:234-1037(-)
MLRHCVGSALRHGGGGRRRRLISRSSSSSSSSSSAGELATPWGQPRAFTKSLAQTVVFIGISMGTGDAICQHLEQRARASAGGGPSRSDGWDPDRSARMAVIGTFITGPFSHCWQLVLETLIPGNRGARVLLLKISANAALAFVFSIPLMFTAVTLLTPAAAASPQQQPHQGEGGMMEGGEQWRPVTTTRKTLKDARQKIQADLVPTFAAGTLYWPAANCVVFMYCPVQRRAIVNSFCGVLWNIFLSFQANSAVEVETDEASDATEC